MIANCSRTTIGRKGSTGSFASAGGVGRGRAGRSAFTRRMNSSTSWFRGTNATTNSSSPIFPTSANRVCGQVPRVLVVEDHRQAVERLELGHRLGAVEDLLVAVGRVVRVVGRDAEREVLGIARDLRHGRLDRRQLGRVVALVAEDVEQAREDPVLGFGVRLGRELGPCRADGGDLALALLPGRQQRQEDVIAVARKVAPPDRALLVHRHRVAVAPHQVHGEVAEQLVAGAVLVGIDPLQDLGAGRRLGLEVALDHRLQLLQRLENREVQGGDEVRREDETVVAVEDEGPHHMSSPPSTPQTWPVM